MSLAFTTTFPRAFPSATARLTLRRAVSPRTPVRWHASAADTARAAIAENGVMVFSTTYCPYCARVKGLFRELGVEHEIWELDERADGSEIRSFLLQETGQRTVPNVFVSGKHVGGCDDTLSLHGEGKLLGMINA